MEVTTMFSTTFTMTDSTSPVSGHLRLLGRATLESCLELKTALLDALDKTEILVVDVSQVTELDVAALQIFCAARKSTIKREKEMVLADKMSEDFARGVLDAGYNRTHSTCCWLTEGKACLWGNCDRPTGRKVE
jgi:anti-anti-sigma regulatory factor